MKTIKPGLIVSIQGYRMETTAELAWEAENGGAVAIRTDKPVIVGIPVIGLNKIKVANRENMPYITPTIEAIKSVREWADYVAIDYRAINKNVLELSDYCKNNEIPVIADIRGNKCYNRIIEKGLYFTYLSTTFGVFDNHHKPSIRFVNYLSEKFPGKVIAEGGYSTRSQVEAAYKAGAVAVCVGGAISDIYKLTKKYSSIDPFDNRSKRG